MCTGAEIGAVFASIASSVAGSIVSSALAPKPKSGGGAAPAPTPQLAPGPAPAPDRFTPAGSPGEPPLALSGAGITNQMNPLQRATSIATGGVSGDSGLYRDPQTVNYYRNAAFQRLVDPTGAVIPGASFMPIEKQYLERIGADPSKYTGNETNRYLAALENWGSET